MDWALWCLSVVESRALVGLDYLTGKRRWGDCYWLGLVEHSLICLAMSCFVCRVLSCQIGKYIRVRTVILVRADVVSVCLSLCLVIVISCLSSFWTWLSSPVVF